MKIKPLNDRVLVKRMEEVQVTKGGILIPDTAKEKPIEGKVIAVGPGKMSEQGQRMALQLKEGDRVLFGKYAGTEIKTEGEEFLMMREEDILAVIND
ncbi:MAG: co-chaperone GroES [Syntrophobacterales bacterium RIFOXYC2_FULL_60_23]|jgi:chaperonin GroES|nr:MAG: co-chaperone GroES [Syntrophobacterales bacterium RIFOXYC2_FULL_60_23]